MNTKPNLIFLLTDQQRRDSMSCYGNNWIKTPNMDSLASQSFVFENAYVTQPVCTPARSSIMTGLYPQTTGVIKNGIPLSPQTRTIAEMISNEYSRAYMGKWHLGDETTSQHGFENWISIDGAPFSPDNPDVESDYSKFLQNKGHDFPPPMVTYEKWAPSANLTQDLTPAYFLGEQASTFISEHASKSPDQPFMMYISFFEPHPPYTGPLNNMYAPEDIEVGPAFLRFPEQGSMVNKLRSEYYLSGNLNPLGIEGGDFHDTTSELGWRKLRAQYFANLNLVDNAIGNIIRTLNQTSMADNTIIVLTSEHGEMAGDHGMLEKRSMYEEASRVPLLIKIPWLSPETDMVPGNFSQVDLVPTLLDLLGEEIPEHLDGANKTDVFQNPNSLRNNDVFIQWNGQGDRNLGTDQINRFIEQPWRSVVTGDRWKLNLSPGDTCELYDLYNDPYEMVNLYDQSINQSRVKEMTNKIQLWLNSVGDTTMLPAGN